MTRILLVFSALLSAGSAIATTFTVTNTADGGAGSFRQAILDANTTVGADTIAFAIPGSGVHTISPATALPVITDPVAIDGYSQPGASANTLVNGDDAVLLIELDGTVEAGSTTGVGISLATGSDGSSVRGLVINRWFSQAVHVQSGSSTIAGNFIGTDPSGTLARPSPTGIGVVLGSSNVVGGTAPADRNLISGSSSIGVDVFVGSGTLIQGNFIGTDASGTLALPNATGVSINAGTCVVGGTASGAGNLISGNTGTAVSVASANSTGTSIQGNRIGTDVTGTQPIGNGSEGIQLNGASNVAVGGAAAGAGNLISANQSAGISVTSSTGNIILGNKIGTDLSGVFALPNATGINFGGIFMNGSSNCTIGGPNPGEGNVIAFNVGNGVTVYGFGTETGNTIRGNSIFAEAPFSGSFHSQLGIDLGDDGPTPNDPLDSDSGWNNLQNYPIVTSAIPSSVSTEIIGVLHSAPSTMYALDFYENAPCLPHPHDFYEGQTYLGSGNVTTGGGGTFNFDVIVPVAIQPGSFVTATATDPSGNTSEFSPRIVYSISPASGPASGGTPVTIAGTEFENGATVTIGGQPLVNPVVADDHTITGSAPALPAGTVNDVTVTDPSTIAGTLVKGWVADFLDVPPVQQFYAFVTKLVANAITVGVGGGLFGVDQSTLRQQMAVFLLKARHGICYTPPPCGGTFADVPCPSTFADWIEALAAEGITGGCGGGNYCPGNPVRRDQMAVFLLKAEHGSSYLPPPCTGIFPDVPCPSTFADWIEQLFAENITGGCGGGNYCPSSPNTRGQMAVFIVKTFGLQ